MTLDEPRGWKAAAALERGENPERPSAQFRLATLLAEHDELHSIHHHMLVAGRVLAFLPRIVAWKDAEQTTPKPKRPGELRQFSSQTDEDFFVEQAHYHLGGYRDAMAALVKIGSVYAEGYDPDARGEREDDRRIATERADESAVEAMRSVS